MCVAGDMGDISMSGGRWIYYYEWWGDITVSKIYEIYKCEWWEILLWW